MQEPQRCILTPHVILVNIPLVQVMGQLQRQGLEQKKTKQTLKNPVELTWQAMQIQGGEKLVYVLGPFNC